ncbi:MAG: hypothetical protein J3R72DRAFT_528788 [Linnemannia gamsii]|nr:MAG: hypothetical protein J3R72DRAFT_528788 [Linnemannia gamsii]
MTTKKPFLSTQAVRRVYEDEEGFSFLSPPCPSSIVYIPSHFDAAFGSDIVLWDDICRVFEGARYVRMGDTMLPFAKGDDFENLFPLRIEAFPGDVLEVVDRCPPPYHIISPLPPATDVDADEQAVRPPDNPSGAFWTVAALIVGAAIGIAFPSVRDTFSNNKAKRIKNNQTGI